MKLSPFSKEMIYLLIICIATIAYTVYYPLKATTYLESMPLVLIQSFTFSIVFYFTIRKLSISTDLNLIIDNQLERLSKKTNISWFKKL